MGKTKVVDDAKSGDLLYNDDELSVGKEQPGSCFFCAVFYCMKNSWGKFKVEGGKQDEDEGRIVKCIGGLCVRHGR